MTSNFLVTGIAITEESLRDLVKGNQEIIKIKEPNIRQITTSIFLNSESVVELLESSENGCLFRMRSKCTPLAKLVIPGLVLYILLS